VPPLCSPANDRFVDVLSLCSPNSLLPCAPSLLPQLIAPPCSPSTTSFSLAGDAFLQVYTRTFIQLVLDADQRGAGYGSTDCPPCYLLLLPSCSSPSLLTACGLWQLIYVPNTPLCTLSSHIHSTYHGLCLSSLYTSQWPGHSCLTVILAPTSTPMVQKKRSAAQFFDDAQTNGLESLTEANINSNKVSKHLEPGTEINYNRMLVLWDE